MKYRDDFSCRKSGLIPLNKDAIDQSYLLPEDFQKNTSTSRTTTTSSSNNEPDGKYNYQIS